MSKRWMFVCLWILGFCSNILSAEDPNAALLFENALEMEKAGETEAAEQLFKEIISEYSSSTICQRSKVRLANIETTEFISKGKYEEAKTKISNVISEFNQTPDISWFLFNSASSFDKRKQRVDAKMLYSMVIQREGESKMGIKAAIKMARVQALDYIDANQFDMADKTALAAFKKYQTSKDSEWGLFLIGCIYDDLNQKKRAIVYYKICSERFKDDVFGIKSNIKCARIEAISGIEVNDTTAALIKLGAVVQSASKCPEDVKWCLYSVGCEMDHKGFYEEALKYYEQLIKLFPNDDFAKGARIKTERIGIVKSIYEGEFEKIIAKIEVFKAVYSNDKDYADAMFAIAENLYIKGSQLDTDGARNPYFTKSKEIIEQEVLNRFENKESKASAYYTIGLNYDGLLHYSEAAEAFSKTVEICSNHKFADYCIFKIAECYEKLIDNGLISEDEGKTLIKAQYNILISDFPKSDYTKFAKERINNN